MGSMTDDELEHLIRSSGAILGDGEVLIIGSQSILPWLRKYAGHPPRQWADVFTMSSEVDIIPIDNDERKSDLIDGTIGESSYFHQTFGVYAQGVSLETVRAPVGWQSRCYPLLNANTGGVIGRCMHPMDLFIAKTIANRPKDGPFLDAMIEYSLVKLEALLHNMAKVPDLSENEIETWQTLIVSRFKRSENRRAIPQSRVSPVPEWNIPDNRNTGPTIRF
ncbi:DUF6036 family nucleotidyltransferase [Ferrimicrobium sp.]|uniref:DUF6036 family nucleotidyltransferase n=2 Tax=Ferrimicrobium sp. TaxID=2926050 RepID=UPI0026089E2E|nr:DUF6036 family nucleotidyltransferase [Ferrimicrobium sp.]